MTTTTLLTETAQADILLDQAIAMRDHRIASLTQAYEDLRLQIVADAASIEEMRQEIILLTRLNNTYSEKSESVSKREGVLEQRNALLEAEVASLRSSTSWRMTAPVRWVLDRLRGNVSARG